MAWKSSVIGRERVFSSPPIQSEFASPAIPKCAEKSNLTGMVFLLFFDELSEMWCVQR